MRRIIICLLAAAVATSGAAEPLLRERTIIPLPHVAGRIDHLALDAAGHRLFIAALGNDSVEVVDLEQARVIATITGEREPQGIAYLPAADRIVVAAGEGGTIDAFDGSAFARTRSIAAEDADDARVDAKTGLVYVGSGSGGGSALIVVDGASMTVRGRLPLPGHPEAFALAESGPRIYVNVPAERAIVVLDRDSGATVATWKLPADLAANFPMALDEANHRLLVACRSPARLVSYDTDQGSVAQAMECVGDADDLFIDARAKRIYVIGGEGRIDVIDAAHPDRLAPTAPVATAAGARTGWFDAALGRVYVACPRRDGHDAEIRVYERTSP